MQAVNNISERAMSSSSKPVKVFSPSKISQSINVEKNNKDIYSSFNESRKSLIFDVKRNVSIGKKQKIVEIYFLKLLLINFG